MSRLTREQIFKDFVLAGCSPTFPAGASQAQLSELALRDERSGYIQFAFDAIVNAQDEPLCREMQDKYPRTFDSIRRMVERRFEFGRSWDPQFDRACGFEPGHRLRPVPALPIASQTVRSEPEKPSLTPEQLEAKIEHERELCRERVRRFRERKRDGGRLAQAEARHDGIATEEQTRHQAFGQTFAGQITAEVSPATLEGKDEPTEPKGPSWQ